MSWDVFISYSREDDSIVDQIEAHLTLAGFRCYRDKHSIKEAEVWRAEIATAIRRCSAVVAIVSEIAAKSKYVSTELSLAQDFEKPIVPVALSRDIRNDELKFILGRQQWIFLDRNLSERLLAIGQAVTEAVERGKYPLVFKAIEEVNHNANLSDEVDFGSNSIGLETHDCDRGIRRLVGSSFELKANSDQYLGAVMQKCPRLVDLDVELQIEKREGPDNDWFGLEFGELWPAGYYQALLAGNGSVRIAMCDRHQRWNNLVQRDLLPSAIRGNGKNNLRVIRKGDSIHVLVNGRHALSCEEKTFKTHRLGLVVAPGISTNYHRIFIKGWAVDLTFEDAFNAFMQLDLSKARKLAKRIDERVPDYRHPSIDFTCRRIFDEPTPDRDRGILIILGNSIYAQLHEGEPANRLRQEIKCRSKNDLQAAFIITEGALSAETRFQYCPWISLGGPPSNGWTKRFTQQFPSGKLENDAVRVQERIAEGDKRVLLWGNGREETVSAVDHFINHGGLDKYLELVWL